MVPSGNGGSCDGRDVDMMVTEAATLAQNAINAIDTLLGSDIPYNSQNERIANNALAHWGIEWSKTWFTNKISVKSGTDTLSTAQGYYQLVLDKLVSGSVDGARLVCGDEDWKWVTKLGDLGQSPPDKLISDEQGQDPIDNPGYYLSQHFSVMVPSEKLKSGYGGGLCTDSSTDGETWAAAKFIMMCDRSFDGHTESLASMIAGQDSIPSGTELDSKQTTGAVFLHEMMHWINKQIIDVVITLPIGKTAAYGFNFCAGLNVQPGYEGKAVQNADNFRSFAMAVTLNKIDWSNGEKP
ncbi:hypothetical protein FQN54_005348 [Arachnomyces sp. PD_36]|nr:hypothetical protein FQN54_005348 [Arachnomyces sp. PD_36]